jgi:hypothetical protein
MQKLNALKSLVVATTLAPLAGAVGTFLFGGKAPSGARADQGAATEMTAAAAGARITPTEPKLRIEPK